MNASPRQRMHVGAPRIVLDTNVCLDLFVFGDPNAAALDAALRGGKIVAVTREDCRDEWRRVLRYPHFGFDEATCARLEAAFDGCTVDLAETEPSPRTAVRLPRCKDADDQKFIELAWRSRAVALITRDDALLALATRARRDGLFAILTPQAWTASLDAPDPSRTQHSTAG